MSNRKYRAVKVKQIIWEKIIQKTQDQEVVFNIDTGKQEMFGNLMVNKESIVTTIKWKHPVESREVIYQISQKVKTKSKSLVVAIEPSGTYGDPLIYHFRQAGVEVRRISPKKTFDAKEVYDGVPSLHDAKSAYVIGRLHLDGNSQLWEEMPEQQREMNALIGTLHMHKTAYQRNLNRLEGRLARHWPEILSQLRLDSVTLEGLLIEYGTPRAIAAHSSRAKTLMRRIGCSFLKEEKIENVLSVAMCTLGVPCIEAEREALQRLATELQRQRLLVKEARQRVEQASTADKDINCLSDAVGRVTAAVLVAKVGAPSQYRCSHSYVKAMGLNLKEKSSGQYKGQKKISKRGYGMVRMYLYFAALRLTMTDPVVRAWYKKKVKRDGGIVKMKAVTAVMRKLAKALWYVGQGEVFDSSRLFNKQALGLD